MSVKHGSLDPGCTAFSSGYYFALLDSLESPECENGPYSFDDSKVSVNVVQTREVNSTTVPGMIQAAGGQGKKGGVCCPRRQRSRGRK